MSRCSYAVAVRRATGWSYTRSHYFKIAHFKSAQEYATDAEISVRDALVALAEAEAEVAADGR